MSRPVSLSMQSLRGTGGLSVSVVRTDVSRFFQKREKSLFWCDVMVRAGGVAGWKSGGAHKGVATCHAGARRTAKNGRKVL
ncbi:hypothetical protein HED60_08220 [Planctomycetales bacterium ZRK34]|nr:hypothetical protein HED60_08220 [Planctomycetales bacterium ZRK34]